MAIFRKSAADHLAELDGESCRLEQQQREYLNQLRQGLRDAADPSVLPPPEEWTARHTRRCCTTMPRHQKRCEQQSQAAALLLFVVLSISSILVLIWMLHLAQM